MKYKCLVLDHDDTVVKSTLEIHYPAFLESVKVLRPNLKYTFEEFATMCFHPGFMGIINDILKLNEEEMKVEHSIWKSFTEKHIPHAYEGMKELLLQFKEQGGIITVVSHSEKETIKRDFLHNFGFEPDSIFGWELPEHQRKPYPYPLEEIMRRYQLKENELIMLDDSKPGYDMCKTVGVPFIGTGYYHNIPEIREFMQKNADYYVLAVSDLYDILF